MATEMNDVSMDTEVTSVKTTPTQRRSRVNPVGRVVTLVQQMARKTEEENQNEHRDCDKRNNLKLTGRTRRERNTETNKAKNETKEGSQE